MTDLPPGEWSDLLVGHQWPSGSALGLIGNAVSHRGEVEIAYHNYSEQLRSARSGPLASQAGVTADDVRSAFLYGEVHADRIAEKNYTKKTGYSSSCNSANDLRSDLSSIAAEGDAQIKTIQESDKPLTQKVGEIVDLIIKCQT